jgi:hypothetical protein
MSEKSKEKKLGVLYGLLVSFFVLQLAAAALFLGVLTIAMIRNIFA